MENRENGRRAKDVLADDKILAENEDLLFTTASFEFTAQDTEITFRCSATGSEHGDLAVDVRLELNAAATHAAYIKWARSIAAKIALEQFFHKTLVTRCADRFPGRPN